MATDRELRGTLTGTQNVTFLQRWGSAWADLQAADMALYERAKLDDSKAANLFLLRALWESAIAAYGRCAVSSDVRRIEFNELVREAVGDDGMAVHERIMDWRHGHVAHRNRAEFERVEAFLAYTDGPGHPTSLNVELTINSGPSNDDAFVLSVRSHVTTVRDAMWETRMFPLAVRVVEDLNAGRIARTSELRLAENRIAAGQYVLNQCITTLGKGKPIL